MGTPTFLLTSGCIFASLNKTKTFLLDFSVQTLNRKEKQELDEDQSFSINYRISVNTAWNHCPVLINASLLRKHLSANLEALNKTSHEAPQGWFDREPSQEPRQLFLGTWESPTGQGSEAHQWTGARSGVETRILWSLHTALAQPSTEKTSSSGWGHARPLWWSISLWSCWNGCTAETRREPHSTSTCGSQWKDEPTEPQQSRHRPPSLSPGAQRKRSNIPLPCQMGDPSYLQRECPGSVLWNHWCLNYVVFILKVRKLIPSGAKTLAPDRS